MVSGVLWLTWLLVERRQRAMRAVTEQCRLLDAARQELAHSNSELERFSAVVAHDLRGPLSSISMMASLLDPEQAGNSDADSKVWVSAIQTQIAEMDQLMRSLLNYGRAGGIVLQTEPCDCQAILIRTLHKLKADLQACGGEVVGENLPTIAADPTLIAQLFQNLIENAIKYRSQAPPRVSISAQKDDDGWTFSFADNGKGIEPGEAQAIFESYRQSVSDKGRSGGIGLGLATCKRIVERHGGKIWAESQASGSIFRFTLPGMPVAMDAVSCDSALKSQPLANARQIGVVAAKPQAMR